MDVGVQRLAFVGGCGAGTNSEPRRHLPVGHSLGRVCARGPAQGEACYLDADEDDLHGREDELQL